MNNNISRVSANEALEQAVLWSFIQLLAEVKRGNNNIDNMTLREIKAIHANTTKGDLSEHLKKSLGNITHSSMGYLNKNGYKVVPIERS
jgi:hypothetical protein